MEKEKSYNYKIVIGLLLGVILSASGVYAATTYAANQVRYVNTNSSLISTKVQGAIDELATRYGNMECPSNKICLDIDDIPTVSSSSLSLGAYISYTPPKTSYTTDTTYTGYTSTQTINPSELNVWRVLRVNNNGTVDIISENVSSTGVHFSGKTGYRYLVYYLNTLASQYEDSRYTVGSRHFGYNGQTETIPDTHFTNPAPWTCDTGASCNPVESLGGGDTLYQTDWDLVNTALGTRVGKMPGSGSGWLYWVASRYYDYSSSTNYNWKGRYANSSGSLQSNYLYRYYSGDFADYTGSGSSLRPIVTLKSGLLFFGSGTSSNPYEIIG